LWICEEDVLNFSYITLCKNDEPPGEAPFDPRGIILTIFAEDN